MDDSTPAKTDALEFAEKQLAQAEQAVDKSTGKTIDSNRRVSAILSKMQQRMGDANWATSKYVNAAVAASIATELHKSRVGHCKTAQSVLEHANARKEEASKACNELKLDHEDLRKSYSSSQEEALRIKSRLMKQEMDWIGARAHYYSASLQTRFAADQLKICKQALSLARLRLTTAESQSNDARSNLDDIESNMAELMETTDTMNRKLGSTYNKLMVTMSQSKHSEMAYRAADQAASHAQEDVDRLRSEQSELKKQLEAAKQTRDEASKTVKGLRDKIQGLSNKSVKKIKRERSAKLKLRHAEKEVSKANREHDQEYWNQVFRARREQQDHREREHATRAISMLVVLIFVSALALTIGDATEWRLVPLVSSVLIGLSCTLLGSLATRIGKSERSWPRWLQWTGALWKNERSWMRRSWFTRGTRSK